MNLRDLEKAATPAPCRQGYASLLTHVICDADLYGGATVATVNFTSRNAALIAALRNAAPLLLDVVDAARVMDSHMNGSPWHTHEDEEIALSKALAALDEATK